MTTNKYKLVRDTNGSICQVKTKDSTQGKTTQRTAISLAVLGAFSGLFAPNVALAADETVSTTVSTIGQGNIVTGDNGVADGYKNTVTAVKGTAQGNDSIATGDNLSRDEFAVKVDKYSDLIESKDAKEAELGKIGTALEANTQAQTSLNNQIQNLNNLIDSAGDKREKLDTLNDSLATKTGELDALNDTLNKAKADGSTTGSGTPDRTLWTDFTAQLNRLDWNKLSDTSGGTSGVSKVASDLKTMIEADFPEATKHDLPAYETVINGYINRQGLFDVNSDDVGTVYGKNFVFSDAPNLMDVTKTFAGSIQINSAGTSRHTEGTSFSYVAASNSRYGDVSLSRGEASIFVTSSALNSPTSIVNYLEKVNEVKVEDFQSAYDKLTTNRDLAFTQEHVYGDYVLASILLGSEDNAIRNILKSYEATELVHRESANIENLYSVNRSSNTNVLAHSKAVDFEKIKSPLQFAPVKEGEKAAVNFIYHNNLPFFVQNTFRNELENTNLDGSSSDTNVKAYINKEDIDYLKNYTTLFYDKFYDKLDLNAAEDKWLFNSSDYKEKLAKVESFVSLVKEYTQAYDNSVANPTDVNAQIQLVQKYNQIRAIKEDPSNYYENITVEMKDSTKEIWDKYASTVATQFTEYAGRLKLYDAQNEIIKGTVTAAQDLKSAIDAAQKAVDDKQKEIDSINKQINDLALTENEKAADELKKQKEAELAAKEAEKAQLEKDKEAKQAELNELSKQLAETDLKNLGVNTIAHGTNAFASGSNAIAIGTQSTVTSNDGIGIGRDTTVTGTESVAIGRGSAVTGNQSVAVGVGNTVASNNVMVLGNNVNVAAGMDGAVVLGNSSAAAAANPTANHTIRGEVHEFAGKTPTSTVSVGAAGAERQIVNVAAGRISATSTDAINGSQLYAVADAVENLRASADKATVSTDDSINLTRTTKTNPEDQTTTTNYHLTISQPVKDDIDKGVEAKNIVDNKGLTFATESGQTAPAKLGDTVQITGDDNIDTEATSNGIVVKLKKDITADSLTTGNTKLSSDGLDNGGNTIKNVASGGDTDTNGANIGDVKRIVNANATRVTAGDNVTVESEKDENGVTTYKLTAKDTSASVSAASNALTVTPGNPAVKGTTEVTNYAIDLSANTKADIAKGVEAKNAVDTKGLIFVGDKGQSDVRKLGDSFEIKGDTNIVTDASGNRLTVQLKRNVNLDEVRTGDSFLNKDGLNNGGNTIKNVAEGVQDTDAVNVGQLNKALSATELTTSVVAGSNVHVSSKKQGNNTEYKVSADKSTVATTRDLTVVTQSEKADDGAVNTTFTVGLAASTKADIAKGVLAKDIVDTKGLTFAGNSGQTDVQKLGSQINIIGKDNIITTASGNEVLVQLKRDIQVDSVAVGDTVHLNQNGLSVGDNVHLTQNGLNNGGNTITNVAEGVNGTDAVNLNQLNRGLGDLNNRLGDLNQDYKAGVAQAIATANLPQAYIPGKSMVSIAGGNYRGQTGYAVGYSIISDGGNWVIKGSISGNSRNHFGAGIGAGYQW